MYRLIINILGTITLLGLMTTPYSCKIPSEMISREKAINKCFEELAILGYDSKDIASMDIPKSCYNVDSLLNNDFYFSQNNSPRSQRDQEVLAKLNNRLFWSCTFIPEGYIGLTVKIFIDSYSGDVITSMTIK